MSAHDPFSRIWFAHLGVRAAALLGLGAALGVAANQLRSNNVSLGSYEPPSSCSAAPPQHALPPVESMAPEQIAALCGTPGLVVADVRDEERYATGHVAGALHLPCTATADAASRAIALLATNHTLVVYGDDAESASRVAESVRQRAARPDLRIIIMQGGFEAWSRAGLACASGGCPECTEAKL